MKVNNKFVFLFAIVALVAGNSYGGDLFEGQKLYGKHCANCHGSNGRPQLPGVPDFTIGQSLIKSDLALKERVKSGGRGMPGYLGLLKEEQIESVIVYIRSLR